MTSVKLPGMLLDPVKIISYLLALLLALTGWGLSEVWADNKAHDERINKTEVSIAVIETKLGSIDANIERLVKLVEADQRRERAARRSGDRPTQE